MTNSTLTAALNLTAQRSREFLSLNAFDHGARRGAARNALRSARRAARDAGASEAELNDADATRN